MKYFFLLGKYLLICSILFFLTILDMAFFPGLGGNWSTVNITLITAIFLVIVSRLDIALFFYLSSLLLQSFLGADFLIIPALAGISILTFINLLIERLFTNRSYYVVVALSLFGWLSYHFLFALSVILVDLFTERSLPAITLQWIGNRILYCIHLLLLASFGYMITSSFSTRFKSYFITSSG